MSINRKNTLKQFHDERQIKLACLLGFHVWDYDHKPVCCKYCGVIK